MHLKTLESLGDVSGKKILVRVSLDVPLSHGAVRNDFRLRKILPTLFYLKKKKARSILLGHIGRKGESLSPVARALAEMTPLSFVDDIVGARAHRSAQSLRGGEVLLLENLRRDVREEKNDEGFARALASLGDLYVNEAFSNSHRPHASMVTLPRMLPSAAGLELQEEIEHLPRALLPESPSVCIIGGAKFETKFPLIEKMVSLYDEVIVVGALANDFFNARGFSVGLSAVSDDTKGIERLLRHPRITIPTDVVVREEACSARMTTPDDVEKREIILDVGVQTIELIRSKIAAAKTVLWNGPLGKYEAGFQASTQAIAQTIAASKARSYVGGGDTIAAIQNLNLSERFTFLSTGGGAMLEFLAQGTLPALIPLMEQ